MDLENSKERKTLIDKYLNAETSLAEERLLAEFYRTHKAADEESAIARLLLIDPPVETPLEEKLSHMSAPKYIFMSCFPGRKKTILKPDPEIISEKNGRPASVRKIRFAAISTITVSLVAASVIAAIVWLPSRSRSGRETFTPVEIAESLAKLAEIRMGDIESLTARPAGDAIIITSVTKSGETSYYMMTKDAEDGTLHLLSMASEEKEGH